MVLFVIISTDMDTMYVQRFAFRDIQCGYVQNYKRKQTKCSNVRDWLDALQSSQKTKCG